MKTYTATLRHDHGKSTIKVKATDEAAARLMIMKAEGCPKCAVTNLREVRPKQKFTVIGYYEDNGQQWVEWVKAVDTVKAAVVAVRQLERREKIVYDFAKETPWKYFRDNLVIVGIFAGHQYELSELHVVCSAVDWPGLELTPQKTKKGGR